MNVGKVSLSTARIRRDAHAGGRETELSESIW